MQGDPGAFSLSVTCASASLSLSELPAGIHTSVEVRSLLLTKVYTVCISICVSPLDYLSLYHAIFSQGEFGLRSAGGTPLLPTWHNNPQYRLQVPQRTRIALVLEQRTDYVPVDVLAVATQAEGATMLSVPVDSLVRLGFAVFAGT